MNARIVDIVRTLVVRGALVALPVLLAACGGGGGIGELAKGGIVGTGSVDVVAVGAITALDAGKISVNRVKFATTGAAVRIDGQLATDAALQVGMVVSVQGQAGADGTVNATSIDFRYEVQGVVDGVDNAARAFTLLGQRVRTDQLTVFSGGTFETLVNQYVQVSGFRAAEGDLLATRVEIRSTVASGASLEITGVVASLDPVAKTFLIGAQVVDYSQIGVAFIPPGLANGAVFHVVGTMLTSGGRLVATLLEAAPAPVPDANAAKIEVEGLITGFTSATSFSVNGQLVDARGASLSGGTAAMLGNGVKVEIEGSLAQGVLIATVIEIEQAADNFVDGIVEAIDATSVTIAGQRIAVTATTQFEDRSVAALRDFNPSAIHIGDRLSISATQGPGGLIANRIVRLDVSAPATSGPDAKAEGVISGFVSIANFIVGGYVINASSASFEHGVAADLSNGRQVEVEGVLAGNVLLATRVSFETSTPSNKVSVEGTIASFVSLGNFQVSGQTIDARNAQFEGGTAASLAKGQRVQVEGMLVNGTLVATKVSIESAPSAQTLELEGTITAFVSIKNFTVAGQVVDASQATFSNGTAADLANGRRVQVVGPVMSGVLLATRIEVKDAPEQQEASLKGAITNFVSVANFTVAGRTVDASSATFEDGSAAQLANGRQVEVEGVLVGTVLRAKKVSFE